jgi:HEAT repeat protein
VLHEAKNHREHLSDICDLLAEFASVDELLDAVKSSDASVRKFAVRTLALKEPASRRTISTFIEACDDSDETVRGIAADSLSRAGSDALPSLRIALASKSVNVRVSAAEALWRLGPDAAPALPELTAMLKSKDAKDRSAAAEAIFNLGNAAATAAPALIEALKDADAWTRYSAASTLALLGREKPAAVEVLVRLLADKDPDVRNSAINELGFIGADARPAVPKLLALLGDRNTEISYRAAEALVSIGAERKSVAKRIAELVARKEKDGVEGFISSDGEILAKCGSDAQAAMPTLIDLLKNDDTRFKATKIVLGLGPVAKAAAPTLAEHLNQDTAAALAAIGREGRSAIPVLRRKLEDKDNDVRLLALHTLKAVGMDANESAQLYTRLLADDDKSVRAAAGNSLIRSGPPQAAVAKLLEMARGKNRNKQHFAIDILRRLRPAVKEALPVLKNLEQDTDQAISHAASWACDEIEEELSPR